MVSEDLIARTREVLGQRVRRVLITGGTGFVGSHLAKTLAAAGQEVVVTGRNPYLAPPNTHFEKADIRDPNRVALLCKNMELVVHTAAHASPWLSAKQLHATNVLGTKNVVEGCLRHDVQRLIHVSSTALHFQFQDAWDIADDAVPPNRMACGYAESKAEAEQVVRSASALGLNAFIVRARAVFGPGDNHLLPRILHAYDLGRLRQIGDGRNITELTFIDNLVMGLVLAIDRGDSGETCTITSNAPVPLWDLLNTVLQQTGRTRRLKSIPYRAALAYAFASEVAHRVARRRGEPVLTRYTVGLLAKSQTFSPDAARTHLGYEPVVTMEDAVNRTVKLLAKTDDAPAAKHVEVTLHTTGFTPNSMHHAERGAKRAPVRFHAMVAIIRHPDRGHLLLDTGYAPRFKDATHRLPYRLLRAATPVTTDARQSAIAILQREGVPAESLSRIILTHFHPDHSAGLLDFPNADVITSRAAWTDVRGRRGMSAMRRIFLPDLLPDDIEDRLCLIEHFHGPAFGPFSGCFDLFGDGTLKLFELGGHAVGQIGLLAQTSPTERKLFVADAVWTTRTIEAGLPFTLPFRAIAANAREAERVRQKLQLFHQQYPDIEILPTHCPEVAKRYGFDAAYDSAGDAVVVP